MAKQNMSAKGLQRFHKAKPPRGERKRKAGGAPPGAFTGPVGKKAKKLSVPGADQRQRSKPGSGGGAAAAAAPSLLGLSSEQKTLLVGDGDLSFGRALARLYGGDGSRLCVTSYDSASTAASLYTEYETCAAELRESGAAVGEEVDATDLARTLKTMRKTLREAEPETGERKEPPPLRFDRVVFNFPHRGEGVTDQDASVKSHQELLVRFFACVLEVLEPEGEVLVTLKTGMPYELWKVCKLASVGSANALQLRTAHTFSASAFPGYRHRRTRGDASSKEDELEGGARTYVWKRTREAAAEAAAALAGDKR